MTHARSFSILPFLVGFLAVLVALPPTDVVQVCRNGFAYTHEQPWRVRTLASASDFVRSMGMSLRDSLTVPLGAAAAAVAALAFVSHLLPDAHPGMLMAVLPVVGSVRQLSARKNEIADKLRANIDARATETDAAKKDALKAESTALKAELEEVTELLADAQAVGDRDRTAPDPAQTPDAQASARAASIISVRDRAQDDPKRGFKSHTEQLAAIMQAGQTGHIDPRLKPLAAAGSDEQSGHTDPHGGFLLAPAFSPDILSVPAEVDPTAGRTMSVPMTNSRVVFNARVDKNHASSVSGGLTVSRTPVTKAATASRQEFEQVELVAHDLVGAAFATSRILRESPTSFLTLMQRAFGDEFAAKKLDERLNGSGAGEFAGVINDAATITVSAEAGQASDTILFENVNKMVARCWRYGQAIWLANHDALPQLTTLYMPIGTGGERVAIYQPGNEDAPFGTLLGRPIFPTEFCRTVGDKGDLVLGNWSQYLEGNYGQMEEARSIHVRFLEREECFLFVEMNDAKPWWRSALTPKYSTSTLSPFVVLAAR